MTSERVDALSSWASEIFYRRLISVVDDYGRYYANPSLLRAACYPLKLDKVSNADVEKWLADCAGAALVSTYEVEGKRYLQVTDFRQQVRAEKSKYPPPPPDAQQLPSNCVALAKPLHTKAESESGLTSDAKASSGCDSLGDGLPLQTPPTATNGVTPGAAVWNAYAAAYERRYGVVPATNAKVRSQCKNFAESMEGGGAPDVAAWFVQSNEAFYVRRKHDLGQLVVDAAKLRTEWLTRKHATETEARQVDRTAATGNVFRNLIEEFHGSDKDAA